MARLGDYLARMAAPREAPRGQGGDLASGIIATAAALGMDPADLATIISYETAGTFDPTKAGPTTQWGQHRGLIQFGEPQARQYGVDWSDPLGSQLGPDGAIVRYFRENGWRPGMGILDAYSIVNAGGPGRYNASDANNGGAPGTVADKVREQMDGHRRKAEQLLGGAGGGQPFASYNPPPEAPYRPAPWEPPSYGPAGGFNALAMIGDRGRAPDPLAEPARPFWEPPETPQADPAAFLRPVGERRPRFGFDAATNPYLPRL